MIVLLVSMFVSIETVIYFSFLNVPKPNILIKVGIRKYISTKSK